MFGRRLDGFVLMIGTFWVVMCCGGSEVDGAAPGSWYFVKLS